MEGKCGQQPIWFGSSTPTFTDGTKHLPKPKCMSKLRCVFFLFPKKKIEQLCWSRNGTVGSSIQTGRES
jgi:hypothetical protein